MKHLEFQTYQEKLFQQCSMIGTTKGYEYANSPERFDNFNRLSKRLGISREHVLYVYLVKHMDSIESYIKKGHTLSDEPIRDRIVDAITYLSLLAGMIEETPCDAVSGALEHSSQQNALGVEEQSKSSVLRTVVEHPLGTLTEQPTIDTIGSSELD